jgi:hypothetical protein
MGVVPPSSPIVLWACLPLCILQCVLGQARRCHPYKFAVAEERLKWKLGILTRGWQDVISLISFNIALQNCVSWRTRSITLYGEVSRTWECGHSKSGSCIFINHWFLCPLDLLGACGGQENTVADTPLQDLMSWLLHMLGEAAGRAAPPGGTHQNLHQLAIILGDGHIHEKDNLRRLVAVSSCTGFANASHLDTLSGYPKIVVLSS